MKHSEIYKTMKNIFLFQEETKKPKITSWFINGKDQNGNKTIPNSVCRIEGYDCIFRHRAEMIVVNNGKIFCQIKDDKTIKLPGGGLNKNESAKEAAIRETHEEAFINTKNVQYAGYEIIYPLEPKQWEIDAVGYENVWHGRYVEIFVGQFSSKFKGNVKDHDLDDLKSKGDWYPIAKVFPLLSKGEQEAFKKFM